MEHFREESKILNPEYKASVFSRWFFIWSIPFFKKIINDPSYSETPIFCTESVSSDLKLKEFWEKEIELAESKQRPANLWNAILNLYGNKRGWLYSILFISYAFLRPALCILLAILIRTFRDGHSVCERCLYGSAFMLISFVLFTSEHFAFYYLNKIGIRIKSEVSTLLYRKILKLESKYFNDNTWKVTKLFTKDLKNLELNFIFGLMSTVCIIQIIVIIIVMLVIAGYQSLFALWFIVIIAFPLNQIIHILRQSKVKKVESSRNFRFKFTKETLTEMRTIKLNTWEHAFEKTIKSLRKEELKNIKRYFNYKPVFINTFLLKLSAFILVVSLLLYNKSLLPEHIFPSYQLLFISLISLLYWIPKSLVHYSDLNNTLIQINRLLLAKEIIKHQNTPNEKPEIFFNKICVGYNIQSKDFNLRIDNIKIKPGSLCMVIGPKNAGKTTLLQLILNEITPKCGTVTVRTSLSYCHQKPWLYTSTIRNNILFGKPHQELRYQNIINLCHLYPGLNPFMNGDMSCYGQDGVYLEPDQKARISLARAVYQEADIYLIDDIFSSVDTDASCKIFDGCFLRYLARKTRVIVSNQVEFLDKADQIIVVDKGKAQIFDNLTQIMENKIDINDWINNTNNKVIKTLNRTSNSIANKINTEENKIDFIKTMFKYLEKGKFILLTLFFLLTSYTFLVWCDYWITYWSTLNYIQNNTSEISSLFYLPFQSTLNTGGTKEFYNDLLMYGCLIFVGGLMGFCAEMFLINLNVSIAKRLYEMVSFSVLRAPLGFIYNNLPELYKLFSYDVEIVDKKLPEEFRSLIQILLYIIGCFLLIFIADYIFILFVIIIVIVNIFFQKFYLKLNRILENLLHKAQTTILLHLKESMKGALTIRALNGEEKSISQFNKYMDSKTNIIQLILTSISSLIFWTDILSHTLQLSIIFGFILIKEYVHPIDPSYVGLAILQVYQLSELLIYNSRKLNQTALSLNSVNRIIQFTKIPTERENCSKYNESIEIPSVTKEELMLTRYKLKPESWPLEGEIVFKNVSLIYPSNVKALDDISIKINKSEKVGIVGRCGSGKSSLVSALINLYDFEGQIFIDNYDTRLCPLDTLRKGISIVETPRIFTGSIAYNLDPLGQYLESHLWNVLEEVKLNNQIESLSELVHSKNFTKGQILLLNLARVILHKNKIIIFDEVATNIDEESTSLFYKLIKKHFFDCTVLHITNTLNMAIIECDRVLVMDKGKVVDFDHPFSLLESEGAFFKLVLEAGKSVYSHYRHLAYQQYITRFTSNKTKE